MVYVEFQSICAWWGFSLSWKLFILLQTSLASFITNTCWSRPTNQRSANKKRWPDILQHVVWEQLSGSTWWVYDSVQQEHVWYCASWTPPGNCNYQNVSLAILCILSWYLISIRFLYCNLGHLQVPFCLWFCRRIYLLVHQVHFCRLQWKIASSQHGISMTKCLCSFSLRRMEEWRDPHFLRYIVYWMCAYGVHCG